MSGNAKLSNGMMDFLYLFIRVALSGYLLVTPLLQLMSFAQVASIIGAKGFFLVAAVPMLIVIGATVLAIGLKTRVTAIALLLLMAGLNSTYFYEVLIGASDSAFDWRLVAILSGLMVVAMLGAGRLSVDGLLEARRLRSA
jgi:uncharacterized membrane protein YphA (DoxX/SURF4 family)